jgi:hypothetical protein
MATLPSGAPYMLGSDAADTIDTYTKDNADYWDARTARRMAVGTSSSFGATTTVNLTSFGFTATPTIIVTVNSSASTNTSATVSGASSTGFTISKWTGTTAASVATTVNWVAIQWS